MMTTEDQIVSVLQAYRTIYFCDACLALKFGASLQEAHEALARLDGLANFRITQAKCSECLRVKIVACAIQHKLRARSAWETSQWAGLPSKFVATPAESSEGEQQT